MSNFLTTRPILNLMDSQDIDLDCQDLKLCLRGAPGALRVTLELFFIYLTSNITIFSLF